ncbi:MAG: HigA family addiction module antitoxin [Kiloniellales bacterium]|nr:HigA family addiction module antitoxin [Kiloniellales bacterium]
MDRHHSIAPIHPGEILREDILPVLGVSKTKLSQSLGISRQTLYDILNERQPVTAEMAVRFGKLFGNGARFWLNLQRNYDLIRGKSGRNFSALHGASRVLACGWPHGPTPSVRSQSSQ